MTGSRRRMLIDRRRRRADARPIRRKLAALDSGKELAEAVFGPRTFRIAVGVARERPALLDETAS